MKKYAWMLGLAGMLRLMTGCATPSPPAPLAPARPSGELATGFINKYLLFEGTPHRYVVYVPYTYTPSKAWPLIVFLHGAGERGSDGLLQTEVGIGTAIRRFPDRFPAIVLFPQCPNDEFWDVMFAPIEHMMACTRDEYAIDPSRIYLTGLSMGAYGAWLWASMRPDTFAALMPICGGGNVEEIAARLGRSLAGDYGAPEERIRRLATLPTWVFHGADDPTVPVERSREMVAALKAAGGNVQYTEFPNTGHNSWDPAYTHKEAIRWLFKQRRP